MASEDIVQDDMSTSVGLRLRRAREARGMTVEGVSAAIKLSPRQVEAIEADDYGKLLSATYARGFIRNYASLMGLDPATLLVELDHHHVRATPELVEQADVGVAMPRQSARRKWLLPVLAMSMPALAALALYVWFEFWPSAPVDPSSVLPASPVVSDGTPASLDEGDPAPAPSEPLPVPGEDRVPEAAAADATPAAVEVPAQPAEAVPQPGQKQLVFSFTAESWVEIRDAQDRIIVSDLNRAGSTRTVATAVPVSLVIGNARAVKLTVDGEPYDLTPSIKVEVARVRLE